MNPVALINCYFGKLPEHFNLFLKSCSFNKFVDFYVFTDDDSIYTNLSNVKIIKTSFANLQKRIKSKFDFDVALKTPYKLCDLKPAFGYIFEEELSGYDFWGYNDLDMIFGDLSKFITKDILNQYDKIYQLGHLTLYRNTPTNNRVFLKDGSQSYKTSFLTEIITIFDEVNGIEEKYKLQNIPTYTKRDYADISVKKHRFTLCNEFLTEEEKKNNNYKYQIFYFENGKIFRDYFVQNEMHTDEFDYIHFSSRKLPVRCSENSNSFYITNTGFYEKSSKTTIQKIKELNPESKLLDFFADINYWKKRATGKVKKTIIRKKERNSR